MSPDELDNLPPPPPPTLNDLPSLGDFDRPPNYGEVFTNDLPPSYTVEESARKSLIGAAEQLNSLADWCENRFVSTQVVPDRPVTLDNALENGPFGSEEFVDTAENVVTALSSMSQSIYCLSEKFKLTLDELGTKVNTLAQDVSNLNRQTQMYEKKRQMHYIKNSLAPFQQYEHKLGEEKDYSNLKYNVYTKSDKGLGAKFKRMSYDNFEELDLTGHGFAMTFQQMGTDTNSKKDYQTSDIKSNHSGDSGSSTDLGQDQFSFRPKIPSAQSPGIYAGSGSSFAFAGSGLRRQKFGRQKSKNSFDFGKTLPKMPDAISASAQVKMRAKPVLAGQTETIRVSRVSSSGLNSQETEIAPLTLNDLPDFPISNLDALPGMRLSMLPEMPLPSPPLETPPTPEMPPIPEAVSLDDILGDLDVLTDEIDKEI